MTAVASWLGWIFLALGSFFGDGGLRTVLWILAILCLVISGLVWWRLLFVAP